MKRKGGNNEYREAKSVSGRGDTLTKRKHASFQSLGGHRLRGEGEPEFTQVWKKKKPSSAGKSIGEKG